MRQLSNHQTAASELRQQRVFARQSSVLRDVFDFQQQLRRVVTDRDLSDGTIQNAVDATRRGPGKLALHDSFTTGTRAFEKRRQRLRAARQFTETSTECLIGT